jgi:capsid protein
LNLVQRIAGAARLLATGKLGPSTGFDGAQMQRRLVAWRTGDESINSLILRGGELQRARARQLVRTNPYASNAGRPSSHMRWVAASSPLPGRGRRTQG